MSILLKVNVETTGQTKTMKFPPDIAVAEVLRDLREKFGGGKDHGLFEKYKKKGYGRWLEPKRTLRYYDIMAGTELSFRKKHRMVKIKMVDGATKTVVVDVSQVCDLVRDDICKHIRIANPEEYGLRIEGKPETEWLISNQMIQEQGFDEDEMFLILEKRFFYYDQNIDRSDPVQLHLLYVQAKNHVVDGSYPTNKDEAIALASVQVQIEHGDYNPARHKSGFLDLQQYVSRAHLKQKGLEKQIYSAHQKLVGMSEINAKYRYVQMVRSLSTYGITFFEVKYKAKDKKSKGKVITELLGITKDRLIRCRLKTREVYHEFPLTHLKRWAATGHNITFDFGDHEEDYLIYVTPEGEAIAALIAGYIDIILKARKDVSTVMEEDDTMVGSVSDMVAQRGQANVTMTQGESRVPQGRRMQGQGQQMPNAQRVPGQRGLSNQANPHGLGQGPQGARQIPESEKVKILDLKSAQKAMKLLVDELEDPNKEHFKAIADMAEMGLPSWRDQLGDSGKAIRADVAALAKALEGNPDPASLRPILRDAAKKIGEDMRKLGQAGKALTALGDINGLDSAIAKVARATAALMAAAEKVGNNPHDPKTKAAFLDALRAHEEAGILMDSAVNGELCDGGTQDLLKETSDLLSEQAKDLIGQAQKALKDVKDGRVMRAMAGEIKNVIAAEKALMGTVDTLAGASMNPVARKKIQDAGDSLLGPIQRLTDKIKDNCTPARAQAARNVAMDVEDSIAQLKAAVDCAEPNYASLDLNEPHTQLLKALPMLKNITNGKNMTNSLKKVMINGSNLAKSARLLGNALGGPEGNNLKEAAKELASGLEDLLKLGKIFAQNPNDPRAKAAVQRQAEKIANLANAVAAQANAEDAAMRKAAKAAITGATLLNATMGNVARTPSVEGPAQAFLKSEAQKLGKSVPEFVEALKWATKDPMSREAQNNLITAAKKAIYPMSNAVASVKKTSPKVRDTAVKAKLNTAALNAGDKVAGLAAAIKMLSEKEGDKEIDEALDQMAATKADLEAAEFAIDAGAVMGEPGQGMEGASLLLAQAGEQLANAMAGLISSAKTGKGVGDAALKTANATAQVGNASKLLMGSVKDKTTQKKILANAQDLNQAATNLISAAKMLGRLKNDPTALQNLDEAQNRINRALDGLISASKGLDAADIDEAVDKINKALARLQKPPNKRLSRTNNFKEASNALVGSTKALNAAAQQLVYTAKKNPRGVGPPAKMVASTVDNLVNVAQNAIVTSPDQNTAGNISNAANELVRHAPVLLGAAKKAASERDEPSARQLDSAAKGLSDKIRQLVSAASQGNSFPEVDSAIQKIMERANALDGATSADYRTPEELLKNFEDSTQNLARGATKVMSAARAGSPKLGEYAKDCLDSVDDILSAAASAGAKPPSDGRPVLSGAARHCIEACDAIIGNPGNNGLVGASTKRIAMNASKLIGDTKSYAQRCSDPAKQQAALKLAHGLAQGASGLARAAKAAQQRPGDRSAAEALTAAAGVVKERVNDIARTTGESDGANVALDNVTVDKIKTTSKRLALSTTGLLQAATLPSGSGKSMGVNLNAASKQVSEAIQEMLDACKSLDPAIYECDAATLKAENACQALDEALMKLAVGRLDKKGAIDQQKAQADLVGICKNVATNMAKLVNGARGSSRDLRLAAKDLGDDLPALSNSAKIAAISTSDGNLQKDLLQISRELADGLMGLFSSCKTVNPDNRASQADLLKKYKGTSNTLGQLVTRLKGNAMVAQELDNTISQIRKCLQMINKPSQPSGRSYQDIKKGLTEAMKDLSESALKLSATDKTNIGQVSIETKNLGEVVPKIITEVKDAIATTSEAAAKKDFQDALGQVVQAVLELAESAKLLSEAPRNRQHHNKMANSIKKISATMGKLGKAAARGSTGERMLNKSIHDVQDAVKTVDSAAIYAQAGQLDAVSGAGSMEELGTELGACVVAVKKTGKEFEKAVGKNPLALGKSAVDVARAVKNTTETTIKIASKCSDPDSCQAVLTAAKTLNITAQQLLLSGRDAQQNPQDNVAQKALASAIASLAESGGQLVEEVKSAAAAANRAEQKLEGCKQDIEFLLSNPLPSTTGQPADVIAVGKKLHDATADMVLATSEEAIIDKGHDIFDAVKLLLAKSKGVTRLSADKMAAQHLVESSRITAKAAIDFLESSKINRSLPNAKNDLDKASAGVTLRLKELITNLKSMFPDHQIDDFIGGDVQSIHQKAENSLSGAARAVDEAAKLLMGIQVPKRRTPKDANVVDMTDLSEEILNAARQVAKNTGGLIRSATVVQGERKESSFQGKKYHDNPTWGRGLISAAHMVGAAINYLVSACDKSVKGKVMEEELIASANQVNAATAQLVSASNVRVDPNSPNLRKLALSAKSVAKSTQSLINAAQSAADFLEEQRQKEEREKFTMTNSKVKAMEQQVRILQLEKELERERKKMLNMRKKEYQ